MIFFVIIVLEIRLTRHSFFIMKFPQSLMNNFNLKLKIGENHL